MKRYLKLIISIPNRIFFNIQCIRFKPKCKNKPMVNGRMILYSLKGTIHFGDNVQINSGYKYAPAGGAGKTIIYAKPGAKIWIGNNAGISNTCIYAAEDIFIGDNVMIGASCGIYDTDYHSLDPDQRGKENEYVKTSPVRIMDHVFVGTHSLILKGVTIGENSIIAAGSVVTKDVPPNQIWGGNPAHYIKDCES